MSRNRARNNVINHPMKKSNARKREEAAMKMAKDVRATINGMNNLKSANMDFIRKCVKDEVRECQEGDSNRKDFWRLVGEEAVKILETGKDMVA
jgi:hypothetical protein